MAYHLGLILERDFDFQAIAVRVADEATTNVAFGYEAPFPLVSIDEMEATICPDDVLVCNPSFSDRMFGFRLRGRKLMYIQGFNTYSLLDCGFDHYVAVSQFVARFLVSTYGLKASVIPPFIDHGSFAAPPAWEARPPRSIYVHIKGNVLPVLDRLEEILAAQAPDIRLHRPVPELLPQAELLRRIGEHRYFMAMSLAEGFGLVPLEAMALGTAVTGFDGFGGRDYMRSAQNCLVASYPDIERVARQLVTLIRVPDFAARLAEEGRRTALAYTRGAFEAAWRAEIALWLSKSVDQVQRS